MCNTLLELSNHNFGGFAVLVSDEIIQLGEPGRKRVTIQLNLFSTNVGIISIFDK